LRDWKSESVRKNLYKNDGGFVRHRDKVPRWHLIQSYLQSTSAETAAVTKSATDRRETYQSAEAADK
jgi:hypothetical protein